MNRRERHKKLILLSLLVGLVVGYFFNLYSLSKPVHASNDDYWKGQVDQKMLQGEERDKQILAKLDETIKEVKGICNDITEIKIQAARNGVLYGTGSSIVAYIGGLLLQFLFRRKGR